MHLLPKQMSMPGCTVIRYVCNKNETTGDMVKILAAYPGYAVISRDGGITSDTVNWRHLAPHPGPTIPNSADPVSTPASPPAVDINSPTLSPETTLPDKATPPGSTITRSGRLSKPPLRLGLNDGENVELH